jgi:anti-sigma factor RsiW
LSCPSPDVSAYLDGELSVQAELELEMHVAVCRACADELNLQKSFLNALGSTLDQENAIELPSNFAKAVVTNAESRVSGLRHPHERRNAGFICAALIVLSVIALGSNTAPALAAATAIAETFFVVAEWAWHFVYDIALGSTIVFRSLASAFLFDSAVAIALVLGLFVLSLYVFSRLLYGFRRT